MTEKCRCSVKIKNITVRHGEDFILKNVSFNANHGEILALIGCNGAGKTTLLKTILNSIKLSGKILFFDHDGKQIFAPKIGYVPQKLQIEKDSPMTVLDLFCTNDKFLPIFLGNSKKMLKKATEVLKKTGAENLLNKKLGELSGGELQRVLLAFALEPRPAILLLDEPASAVDSKGRNSFYEIISNMRKDYHMPVIIVSHDLSYVKQYATRYILLNKFVIEEGNAENMVKSEKIKEVFGYGIDI